MQRLFYPDTVTIVRKKGDIYNREDIMTKPVLPDTHLMDLLEVAAALVDDNHADSPGMVILPAGERMAKARKSLASPKTPIQYVLQLCEWLFFRKGAKK